MATDFASLSRAGRSSSHQPGTTYAPRQWGDTSRRFGTARRDPRTGRLSPGEVDTEGQAMPSTTVGGPGAPMTRDHSWAAFNRAFPAAPAPAPVIGNALDPRERQAMDSAPAPTVSPSFPRPQVADGGYGNITDVTGSSGAVHHVQSQPNFTQVAASMGFPRPSAPVQAPVVGGTTFANNYGSGSVRDASTTQPGGTPGAPFKSRIPANPPDEVADTGSNPNYTPPVFAGGGAMDPTFQAGTQENGPTASLGMPRPSTGGMLDFDSDRPGRSARFGSAAVGMVPSLSQRFASLANRKARPMDDDEA